MKTMTIRVEGDLSMAVGMRCVTRVMAQGRISSGDSYCSISVFRATIDDPSEELAGIDEVYGMFNAPAEVTVRAHRTKAGADVFRVWSSEKLPEPAKKETGWTP